MKECAVLGKKKTTQLAFLKDSIHLSRRTTGSLCLAQKLQWKETAADLRQKVQRLAFIRLVSVSVMLMLGLVASLEIHDWAW